jgi:hypothetical protein
MPTLGELIKKACSPPYEFTKVRVVVSDLGRIIYLRRDRQGSSEQIIDLPPGPETQRLARHTLVGLCRKTGVLLEEFGIEPEPFDFMG